jgi:hypothetical protein
MSETQAVCVYCERNSDLVPLLLMRYQGREVWICPQHLPVLIHRPSQLAEKLPGVEKNLGPVEH